MFEGMSRRSFVKALAASAMSSSTINSTLAQERVAASGQPTEWSYTSGKQYSDPFNQVDVDAVITLPSGQQERMPAFWAGGSEWRVRYAAPAPACRGTGPGFPVTQRRTLPRVQLSLRKAA